MFISTDIANLMSQYFVLVVSGLDAEPLEDEIGSDEDRKFSERDLFVSSPSIAIQDPELAPLVSYDAGTGRGQRTSMSDPSGTTNWSYDPRGRKYSETKVIAGSGGGTFLTGWEYDAADRVTALTYPGNTTGGAGERVTQSYNAASELSSVVGQSTYANGMHYTARGQPTQLILSNGVRQRWGYSCTTTPQTHGTGKRPLTIRTTPWTCSRALRTNST